MDASPSARPEQVQKPVTLTTPALQAQRQAAESVGVATPSPVPDSTFTWGGYFQAIGILILLLMALWFILRLLRRFGGGRFLPVTTTLPRQALRVEAQLPLGQRRGVFVVRFLNKRLVLGVTEQRITLLTEMEADNDEANTVDFHRIMESAQRQEGEDGPRRPVDGAAASKPGPGR